MQGWGEEVQRHGESSSRASPGQHRDHCGRGETKGANDGSRARAFTGPTGPGKWPATLSWGPREARDINTSDLCFERLFWLQQNNRSRQSGAKKPVMRLLQWSRQEMLQHQLTGWDQTYMEGDICKRYLGGKNDTAWIQHNDGGRINSRRIKGLRACTILGVNK